MGPRGILPLIQAMGEFKIRPRPGFGGSTLIALTEVVAWDPGPNVLELLRLLNFPDDHVQSVSQRLLKETFTQEWLPTRGQFGAFFPVLEQVLGISNSVVRCSALDYLRRCGPDATRAAPLVKKLLGDPEEVVRAAATNALAAIVANPAAKRGMK